MRYSTEPRFTEYVKEYCFLSFARKFVDNMVAILWILQQKQY